MSSRPRVFDAPLSPLEFQHPVPRFGLAPFWFWNGEMNETTVREQVRAMHDAKVGGFFIHPRQGMTLPYLSDEFFARVRVAVETAAELNMEAWLYDEFPYPSGIAGGLLTAQNPELKARTLEHHERQAQSGEAVSWEVPLGRVVCALAVPIENDAPDWSRALDIRSAFGVVLTREELWLWPMGHIPYNEKRFMADEGALVLNWKAPIETAQWKLVVAIEREQRGHKYFDCWFDPLHPDAAPQFLKLTHERYKSAVGEWFGTTIPGIFSDEIEPPWWSPQLERALILDWSLMAPALWDDSFPDARSIRLRWREMALELFRERWEVPVARWCEENNLVWCAEKPTYRPSQMALIEQPATDAGHRRVDLGPEELPLQLRANGRAAMSLAEQNGGCEVRCECFHSLGWGATLQDQKWSLDWLGATGVNRFTPHAFYFSSSGLRKFDAAPSFFCENPYFAHFGLLGDYAARLGLALSRGREMAPIALLYPTKRLWNRDKISETNWVALQNALLRSHFGFHILDAPSLLSSTAQDGVLSLGRARYETILVPPFDEGDEELEAVVDVAKRNGVRVLEVASVAEALALLEPFRALSVSDSQNREVADVWAVWRQTPGENAQNIVFLANTSGESLSAKVRIRCDATNWQKWSLEDGSICAIQSDENGFEVELCAFGSALLIGQKGQAEEVSAAQPKRIISLDVSGEWNLTRDEPNALRLNRWRVAPQSVAPFERIIEGNFEDGSWREIEAMPLFHRDKRVKTDAVELLPREIGETVWYRRQIESEIRPDAIELLIENGAIGGSWNVWLNGEPIPYEKFAARALHGHDKTACSLRELWREGTNTLALRVQEGKAHSQRGGLCVPLHLVGNFGVSISSDGSRVLTSPVQRAKFNDLDSAALPHFAGTARFSKRFPAVMFAGFDVLALTANFEDIAQLRFAGQDLGVRAWSPFQWTLPSFESQNGEIEIEIAVTNTLLRFLEGRVWNARSGERRNV